MKDQAMGRKSATFEADDAKLPLDRKAALSLALRHRILTMELQPGAVLDEVLLSEEFGLSRPPVRELLREMAGEGFVELEANRAARVASMSFHSLRNFFLAAPMIYIATTKLAAESATRQEIDEIKHIQRGFRTAVENRNVNDRVYHNAQFHLRIGEAAHNAYLLPSLRRLLIDHARIGRVFYQHPGTVAMQHDMQTALQQHDEIIAAIERRDSEAAGDIVSAHFELSRRNMKLYAVPDGLTVPETQQ